MHAGASGISLFVWVLSFVSLGSLALSGSLVLSGRAAAAAPNTTAAARSALRAVGLQPTAAEVDCVVARSKQTGTGSASADTLLACFAQQVLAEHVVKTVGMSSGSAGCVALALRNTPWVTFVDVYRGFRVVTGGRFAGNAGFQGRYQTFVRGCADPADASPLLLGELTSRWNVTAASRSGARFRPIASWTAVEGSLLAAGDVGVGAQLLAFSGSTGSSGAAGAAGAAGASGATADPALAVNGAALTIRPLPDLVAAEEAVGFLAEAMDAAGRAGPVARSLRLGGVLGPSPVRSRVRVGNVVYAAEVLVQRDAPPALQITAILSTTA